MNIIEESIVKMITLLISGSVCAVAICGFILWNAKFLQELWNENIREICNGPEITHKQAVYIQIVPFTLALPIILLCIMLFNGKI